MTQSWGREHRLGPTDGDRVIGTRVYWNGLEYVSEVEGLPDVIFRGPDAYMRAKENADAATLTQYPHECSVSTCGEWQAFVSRGEKAGN